MIIQIRGTSGSGKTTVMRNVMEAIEWDAVYVEGRRKPLYYMASKISVAVLGHYEESACGGCDTIGSARQVYDVIQEVQSKATVVLCEGLLLSEDTKWSLQLDDLRVVFLTTSLDECLNRIKKRRAKVGNDKPLNPSNTTNRVAVIERARLKLLDAGVDCRRCSSNQASRVVLDWIAQATR